MMDYMLPIAKRTRLKEAEMYQKYHDEIKKKNLQEQSDASESTNLAELGRINSCHSCTNDEADIEFLDEIHECDEGKVFVSLDSDSEDLGNSHVGESTGFCLANEKKNTVDESHGQHHHRSERNSRMGITESSTSLKCVKMKQDEINSLQEHNDNMGSGIESCDALDGGEQEDDDEVAELWWSSDCEDSDDLADDEDYELSESSAIVEESSSGEEEDGRNTRGSSLRKVSDDRDKKAGVRLKRKKVPGIEVLCDFYNCNVADSVGKSHVAEQARSQHVSEGNGRDKLGTVGHPHHVDRELDSRVDGSGIIDYEKAKNGVGDKCGKKLRGRYVTKRKYLHPLKDDEVVKMLANSILNEAEMAGEDGETVVEATLPLKFTFGTEDSMLPQKTEEEKELNELWAEMGLALYGDDDKDNAVHVRDEADLSSDVEHDRTEHSCLENHEFILDEEIGIKCKLCSHVDLEIKYCLPSFGKNASGKWERRESPRVRGNVFREISEHDLSNESSLSFNNGHADTRGTVWDIIPGVKKSLHPHQRDGFEFLWKNIAGGIYLDKLRAQSKFNGGCVVSHAPGTGKTRLAIVFLHAYMKLYSTCRAMVIAPCSMLLTWEAEFRKWGVEFPFHNLNKMEFTGSESQLAVHLFGPGAPSKRCTRMVKLFSWKKERSIIGISYRLFEELVGEEGRKNSKKTRRSETDLVKRILLESPGLLVLDEGHTPRNHHSLIWKALSKIQTEKRIILSGTPFQNNFDELFNTLCLVRPTFAEKISLRPDALPKKRGRKNEAKENWACLTGSIDKYTCEDARAERLKEIRTVIAPFVHVHRGSILRDRLPGLRESVAFLNPISLQKDVIDRIQTLTNPLHLEYCVSVVSVHPSLLRKVPETNELDIDWNALEVARLNPDVGVKALFVMELVRLCVITNEKVLVFSQFCSPLTLLSEQLAARFDWVLGKEMLIMHGKLDPNQRQLLIKEFNNPRNDSKVLLASMRACCEGISLVGASRVVLLDVLWNPSVERQAVSRAYRLGQEKIVYIYHLIASGTMEEDKYHRQAEKERLSELVFYYSNSRGNTHQQEVSEDKKDKILEEMLQREKLKHIFREIQYQPSKILS